MLNYADLEAAFEALPPAGRRQFLAFLAYLQHKYRRELSRPVVQLGGLWAHIDFDISHDDVRTFRERVSRQLRSSDDWDDPTS